MKIKFAYPVKVLYRWPDEENAFESNIVVTNEPNHEITCEKLGIDDDDVVIYTESLDPGFISKHFDGLIIEELIDVGETVTWIDEEDPLKGTALHIRNLQMLFDSAWNILVKGSGTTMSDDMEEVLKMAVSYIPGVIQDLTAEEPETITSRYLLLAANNDDEDISIIGGYKTEDEALEEMCEGIQSHCSEINIDPEKIKRGFDYHSARVTVSATVCGGSVFINSSNEYYYWQIRDLYTYPIYQKGVKKK